MKVYKIKTRHFFKLTDKNLEREKGIRRKKEENEKRKKEKNIKFLSVVVDM